MSTNHNSAFQYLQRYIESDETNLVDYLEGYRAFRGRMRVRIDLAIKNGQEVIRVNS